MNFRNSYSHIPKSDQHVSVLLGICEFFYESSHIEKFFLPQEVI